jgi:hypothetical protein
MPVYSGKRSAGICVVLGRKQSRPPHHLGGAHRHGATYSSHRAPSTYSLGKERVLARLGRAGVIGYAACFFRACGLASASISFPSQRRIRLHFITGILDQRGFHYYNGVSRRFDRCRYPGVENRPERHGLRHSVLGAETPWSHGLPRFS